MYRKSYINDLYLAKFNLKTVMFNEERRKKTFLTYEFSYNTKVLRDNTLGCDPFNTKQKLLP